jgi:hypothetical protein
MNYHDGKDNPAEGRPSCDEAKGCTALLKEPR